MKRRNTGKGRRIGPIVKMALIGVVTYSLLFGMVLLGITPEHLCQWIFTEFFNAMEIDLFLRLRQ